MKLRLLAFGLVMVFASNCSSSSKVSKQDARIAKDEKIKKGQEIVQIPIVNKNDTSYINELRFYKINSSKDMMAIMHQNFGKYNKRIEGKYQDNINQLVWENVELISDKKFTVIADGTETLTNYFASIMVFDKTNKDCLTENNPLREQVLNYFKDKMENFDDSKVDYREF